MFYLWARWREQLQQRRPAMTIRHDDDDDDDDVDRDDMSPSGKVANGWPGGSASYYYSHSPSTSSWCCNCGRIQRVDSSISSSSSRSITTAAGARRSALVETFTAASSTTHARTVHFLSPLKMLSTTTMTTRGLTGSGDTTDGQASASNDRNVLASQIRTLTKMMSDEFSRSGRRRWWSSVAFRA